MLFVEKFIMGTMSMGFLFTQKISPDVGSRTQQIGLRLKDRVLVASNGKAGKDILYQVVDIVPATWGPSLKIACTSRR